MASLLNRPNADVLVYPEIVTVDEDGNTVTGPSETGIPCKARIQVAGPATETQKQGFETSDLLNIRLIGWTGGELGAQATISWGTDDLGRPKMYAVEGEPLRYLGSRRTAHTEYIIRRY
ncbi:hypothetical protein K1X22_01295 [Mycolicibacterium farcinogenes]|uniref:hypothetical protein n=1 Tax=Mycolicibacterium farcinogenes TaxID=1802 RepID=UPI001C8E7F3E|nr:hypothetical protein [Mycolicibacterium farcinogenes]QZH60495.1 hypothetical protein K1X22_01295 [Mycolicibacterium farcinogenes]